MENAQPLDQLFKKFLNKQCSPEEVELLLAHFGLEGNEETLKALIHDYFESQQEDTAHVTVPADSFEKIRKMAGMSAAAIIPFYKRRWVQMAAAAAILAAVLFSTLIFFNTQPAPANMARTPEPVQQEIQPGHNTAMLTLADGSTILLDSAADGILAQQGGISVLKLKGRLSYDKNQRQEAAPLYNKVFTGRGNQYQLELSDGTNVWLNASSSIRFPINFTGGERRVEVSGEAYFEVAKDASRPFRVTVQSALGNSEVEVLGTHFNINAYDDEELVKTTLLEGSIKLSKNEATQLLKPGQQAAYDAQSALTVNYGVDVDKVVA
ncbi:MAG TPA: FecR domain-containing protein, partial [Chitinophagaceae bacterium]|nr:FecR domain-containing protein [Chitinophagaceae bacterium]